MSSARHPALSDSSVQEKAESVVRTLAVKEVAHNWAATEATDSRAAAPKGDPPETQAAVAHKAGLVVRQEPAAVLLLAQSLPASTPLL